MENGDNPPLELRDIKASTRVSRLVFRSSTPDDLYLHYGNRRSPAPRYDIELMAADWLPLERASAALEREEVLSGGLFGGESETSQWPGWIYWGALATVVVALFVIIRKLLPGPPGNSAPQAPGRRQSDN